MDSLYRNTELRKLPPRFRTRLSQLLDINDAWKKLMAAIPSETNPSVGKYKTEHMDLIERHGCRARKSCCEILLDEWSTSGRKRPTVETLFALLQECELYRAADYVAEEILSVPAPQRPLEGPAKRIPEIFDIEELDEPINPQRSRNPSHENKLENHHKFQIENKNLNLVTNNLYEKTFSKPSHAHGPGPTNAEAKSPDLMNIYFDKATKINNNSVDLKLTKLLEQLSNYDYGSGKLIDFTIDVIQSVTNDFDDKFKLGTGAFGTVYKFDAGSRGPSLAIKLLNPADTMIEGQFNTELDVLSKFRHANLVSLIGYCTNGPQYCLVYEFMSGGTLMEALAYDKPEKVMSWETRLSVAHGVIKGIHYLHTGMEKPLIHRDIKSANILLNDTFHAKIGDFGLAKTFLSTSGNLTSALVSTIFGTSAYMAPEAFRGDISPKMDVFSFGVILLEIITGLPPYDEDREEGNDIVTFIEETVEGDDILPWVDSKPDADSGVIECVNNVFKVAQKCLLEKRKRITSELLLKDFQSLILNFTHYCGKTF